MVISNVFPIKYGYNPTNLLFSDTPLASNPPVAKPTVLKYAYIPFGNSGVLQNDHYEYLNHLNHHKNNH